MSQARTVNFYKHHLGDYDAATAHLTWLEDMAYTRLMRLYYRRECGLPVDISECCRLVRASTRQQKEAVRKILTEFFSISNGAYHNTRCDEEIAQYQAQASTNRRIARTRTVQRTAHESSTNHTPNQIPEPDTKSQNHGDGVEVGGYSKAVEVPIEKSINKTPEALRALQNPAWLMSFDHAKMHARKLGIVIAGKTHQELKDAITERLNVQAAQQHQPKFAQSQ